ncbi:MAG: hypothetical protein JWP52_4463 [Rhizobacter sp.]|nr:hypothetical protein [Rhizobacter sp.]
MNHSAPSITESTASNLQARLANFIVGPGVGGLPEAFKTRLQQSLLDSLGCGLHGSLTEWGGIVSRYAGTQGAGDCRLWGARQPRVSSNAAVLANATMLHSFELDDVHFGSRSHPGSVTVPVVLALAESMGRAISGRQLIEALAVGYETLVRVGMCQGVSSFNRGWHPTGTAGVLGAAATAARLLGLTEAQCVHALGVAGTMPCGLMAAQYGAMVKRLYAGHAASTGLMAASLAQQGFTGIPDLFDAEYGGYPKALSDDVTLAPLTDALGDRYEAASIGYKLFSCVGTNHTALEALSRLKREHGIGFDDVRGIEITTSQYQVLHSGWPYLPSTVMAAQMNLQYCTAVLFKEGDVFVDQFRNELLADPRVVDFAARVEPVIDAQQDHKDRTARVVVRLRDGRELRGSCAAAKGHPLNPPDWNDIEHKFGVLAGKVLSDAACREIVDRVRHIDELDDVRTLASLMEPAE